MTAGKRAGAHPTIEPANLRDLPSVLDIKDIMSALRLNEVACRELVDAGLIQKLPYHGRLHVANDEVARFLRDQTELGRAAS